LEIFFSFAACLVILLFATFLVIFPLATFWRIFFLLLRFLENFVPNFFYKSLEIFFSFATFLVIFPLATFVENLFLLLLHFWINVIPVAAIPAIYLFTFRKPLLPH
jgi:hypothetical protein